ncbi:MAG: amidohydrolase [Suipraeoptans sp.]
MFANTIFHSTKVISGDNFKPISGYVALNGDKIIGIGVDSFEKYKGPDTIIIDLGDKLICPGFVDTHCFFTGFLLQNSGKDFSEFQAISDVLSYLKDNTSNHTKPTYFLVGKISRVLHIDRDKLDIISSDVPIMIFDEDFEYCSMNNVAISTYGFTPTSCGSEDCNKLLRVLLEDTQIAQKFFLEYVKMMNSFGITAIKEMGFDDFSGFTDTLESLESSNSLNIRVHFMSQPVGAPMNLDYAKTMREKFKSDFLRFSGFNQMTDGSISQFEGEMKSPYENRDITCALNIDWDKLESDTLSADANDFRFSLHAQGDGAIHKSLKIFEKCKKDDFGKLINRHVMTDLECSDSVDLDEMGKLGVGAEIYPQIMSFASRNEKVSMINEKIGEVRGKQYWNRRKMQDSGINISCATDLPLLYDDIGESIYHSVGALFPEGGIPFNPENALTTSELIRAWSLGGQYNLGMEEKLGTLEEGKLADITVLDRDVFEVPMSEIRDVKVYMTIVNGKIVYQA